MGAHESDRVGTNRRSDEAHHLPEAVAALGLNLTDQETTALEEHYTPHGPSWF